MTHKCDSSCNCKSELELAAMALEEASKLLTASIVAGPDDLVDSCYAFFRLSRAKFCGALAAYKDHLTEFSAAS